MTLMKSLLLGSAAGIVAVASAQAADLPTKKAAPAAADYVKICHITAFGTTYDGFVVPGSDTCLKLFGGLSGEFTLVNLKDQFHATPFTAAGVAIAPGTVPVAGDTLGQINYGHGSQAVPSVLATRDNFEMGYRAYIGFDAVSNTAYGPLAAEIQINDNGNTSSNGGPGGSNNLSAYATGNSVSLDHAWLKWAGLEVGAATSLYDLGNGGGWLDYPSPDPSAVALIAYTATFGGGFSATIDLEDPTDKRTNGTFGPYAANTYHGVQYPDLIAILGVTQSWGSAQIAGLLHDTKVVSGSFGDAVNKWGWGLNAAVSVNIPGLGAGSAFTVQGAYSYAVIKGAGFNSTPLYTYGGGFAGNGADAMLSDAVDLGGGVWSYPSTWTIGANLKLVLSPQISITPELAYGHVHYNNSPLWLTQTVSGWFGGAHANWDPVTNLDFQLDLMYASLHESTPVGTAALPVAAGWQDNSNGFYGRLAITRKF